jgi:hypothetical protein
MSHSSQSVDPFEADISVQVSTCASEGDKVIFVFKISVKFYVKPKKRKTKRSHTTNNRERERKRETSVSQSINQHPTVKTNE